MTHLLELVAIPQTQALSVFLEDLSFVPSLLKQSAKCITVFAPIKLHHVVKKMADLI